MSLTPQEHSNQQRLVKAFMIQSERATRAALSCSDALFLLLVELEQLHVPREVPSASWRAFGTQLDSIEYLLQKLRACSMLCELENVRLQQIEKRIGAPVAPVLFPERKTK